MSAIRFVQSDIDVVELPVVFCEECNQQPKSHFVQIEPRNTGQTFSILTGCKDCCEEFASRFREMLPEPDENGE